MSNEDVMRHVRNAQSQNMDAGLQLFLGILLAVVVATIVFFVSLHFLKKLDSNMRNNGFESRKFELSRIDYENNYKGKFKDYAQYVRYKTWLIETFNNTGESWLDNI
jgi:hypothetical protein